MEPRSFVAPGTLVFEDDKSFDVFPASGKIWEFPKIGDPNIVP